MIAGAPVAGGSEPALKKLQQVTVGLERAPEDMKAAAVDPATMHGLRQVNLNGMWGFSYTQFSTCIVS